MLRDHRRPLDEAQGEGGGGGAYAHLPPPPPPPPPPCVPVIEQHAQQSICMGTTSDSPFIVYRSLRHRLIINLWLK